MGEDAFELNSILVILELTIPCPSGKEYSVSIEKNSLINAVLPCEYLPTSSTDIGASIT